MENKKINKLIGYLKNKFSNPADRIAYLKKLMTFGSKAQSTDKNNTEQN